MMGMQPMEMRPPYDETKYDFIHSCEREIAHDGVVLAADYVGRAGIARTNPDDGERRTVESQEDIEVREDDAEQAQKQPAGRGASLSYRNISESLHIMIQPRSCNLPTRRSGSTGWTRCCTG